MSHERTAEQVAQDYKILKDSLSRFKHTQDLDEEFKRLSELEDQLFVEGKIAEAPEFLLRMNVVIRQGEEGAESTDYHQGEVQGVELDAHGNLKSIILKESCPKTIPFHPRITHISPIRQQYQ